MVFGFAFFGGWGGGAVLFWVSVLVLSVLGACISCFKGLNCLFFEETDSSRCVPVVALVSDCKISTPVTYISICSVSCNNVNRVCVCVCVCACVCERERERVCLCVCVRERDCVGVGGYTCRPKTAHKVFVAFVYLCRSFVPAQAEVFFLRKKKKSLKINKVYLAVLENHCLWC